MTTADRRRIALHESGHAVADVVLGRGVEFVSIRAGRTFLGVAVAAPGPVPGLDGVTDWPSVLQPAGFRDEAERRVISVLAGTIAEMYLDAEPSAAYSGDEAETIAREALATLGPRLAELVVETELNWERESDEGKAARLLRTVVGPDAGYWYLELLRCEAQQLVIRYRAAILRVADALERQAVLAGDQVAALVKGA